MTWIVGITRSHAAVVHSGYSNLTAAGRHGLIDEKAFAAVNSKRPLK